MTKDENLNGGNRSALTRRSALAALLATLGGLLIRHDRSRQDSKEDELLVFAKRVTSLMGISGHPANSEFATAADGNSLELLIDNLLGCNQTERTTHLGSSDRALRKHLMKRITEDYRQVSLRNVRGWWLASTEYNAFALAAHIDNLSV